MVILPGRSYGNEIKKVPFIYAVRVCKALLGRKSELIYIQRDRLSILKFNSEQDTVPFDTLAKVILNRPSNMIYCECKGVLYGIISMGDVVRASQKKLDYVVINRKFTQIRPNEYMAARQIFHEKKNVNALPVVDEDHKLLGAYVRWSDSYDRNMFAMDGIEEFRRGYECVILVRPCEIFSGRSRRVKELYKHLLSLGVPVKDIAHNEIADYADTACLIVFMDEDEFRAIRTYVGFMLHDSFLYEKLITYRQIQEYASIRKHLYDIGQWGVHVLNLFFNSEENDYGSELRQKIDKKFSNFGSERTLLPAMYPQFFDDLYTQEYADNIMHLPVSIETGRHNGCLKDCSGEFYNVINGERYTDGQPEKYQKTIYFVGPCFIYGHYVEDKNTIESLLQKRINDTDHEIKVVNCGSMYASKIDLELARIKELPLKKGDCLVTYIKNKTFSDIPQLDLMEILEERNVNVDWMIDHPMHCNHRINALYAEAVYDKLRPVLEEAADPHEGRVTGSEEDFVKTIYIDRYFAAFDPSVYAKIGSIVMNCNPFTYGHRYLIEEALEKVDFLIIFVVEEDRSLFSFEERFAMVWDGTKDLKNIMVVPSGPFILSQTTFPEYFIKEADEDIVQNVENDITLFAQRIAPTLHISYRFVGEEPEDMVTNEYNSAMKRILPQNGIELVEIPRKKSGKRYISASRVRKCLADGNKEKLYELVPKTTWEILFAEDC